MSEYWKSQPKKQCEYCKCWIADNKASRDFHERGKKHQEMVKQKLNELRKKGAKDAKKAKEMEGSLKAMEKAAMAALKKDLAKNPSMAAQYGVTVKPKQLPVEGPAMKPAGYQDHNPPKEDKDPPPGTTQDVPPVTPQDPPPESSQDQGEWYEAKSEEGYTYYWNTKTGESVWVAPEKYVSIAVQNQAKVVERSESEELPPPDKEETDTTDDVTDSTKLQEKEGENDSSDDTVEPTLPTDISSIPLPGSTPLPPDPSETTQISDLPGNSTESSDTPGHSEEQNEDSVTDPPVIERAARIFATKRPHDAYGGWETVTHKVEEHIDLQLPNTDDTTSTETVMVVPQEPTKIKFREKKVDTLGKEFIAFKKRKVAQGAKNLRQKNAS